MQDELISTSFSWKIEDEEGLFSYRYFNDTSNQQIKVIVSNENKNKEKYYFYQYCFKENKLETTHKYYENDILKEEKLEEGCTKEVFEKYKILSFHELKLSIDGVDTYTSSVEFGVPSRFYSEVNFKSDYVYSNTNDFYRLYLRNVRLFYTKVSNAEVVIEGENLDSKEIKVTIII
jgi:hypothetical protein